MQYTWKKKRKDYLERSFDPSVKIGRNTGGLRSLVKEGRVKKEKRREKGAARSDLSRGNQIFEEQKRENGESASSSLLLGWKIVIVHGESVRFSGQSGG